MEPSKAAIEAALLLCPEFKGNVAALARAVEKIIQAAYAIDFAALQSQIADKDKRIEYLEAHLKAEQKIHAGCDAQLAASERKVGEETYLRNEQ